MKNHKAKIKDEQTPLRIASYNGNLPIVQYLIEKSMDSSSLCFNEGKNDVVKYLISKGVNNYAQDKCGRTLYIYADNNEGKKKF